MSWIFVAEATGAAIYVFADDHLTFRDGMTAQVGMRAMTQHRMTEAEYAAALDRDGQKPRRKFGRKQFIACRSAMPLKS